MEDAPRIGFIGAGRMATAFAAALVDRKFADAKNIAAADVVESVRNEFAERVGCWVEPSNVAVARNSDVLVLAVKPQVMPQVLGELRGVVTADQLVVSIAAGVTISTLQDGLGRDTRIVRVMPNTPCLVGAGASAFALGQHATSSDAQFVESLLSTVGIAVELPERLIDAVTGLSGSGPAYACAIIEALSDGGVLGGLPRDVSTRLAAQTLLGAARMVLETGQHPAALRDAVTSPGGTTIAGLHALEKAGLRGALINAVQAATQRSQELGRS